MRNLKSEIPEGIASLAHDGSEQAVSRNSLGAGSVQPNGMQHSPREHKPMAPLKKDGMQCFRAPEAVDAIRVGKGIFVTGLRT